MRSAITVLMLAKGPQQVSCNTGRTATVVFLLIADKHRHKQDINVVAGISQPGQLEVLLVEVVATLSNPTQLKMPV